MSNGDTIFHKIIRREIPAEIIYEDDLAIAFKDINPAAPQHILVVPKATIPSLREAETEHREVLGHLLLVVGKIARGAGLDSSGYRVVINSGESAGQTVFQLHLHLIGGRPLGWPPG